MKKKKRNKLFTLIELIVVIVVIGLLAAIVIPNIATFKNEAKETAMLSDIRNLQTVTDMYQLDNHGDFPTLTEEGAESQKPTLGDPKAIDFEALYPEYIRDLPAHRGMHYWLDYQGQVYLSLVDNPDDFSQGNEGLSWTADEEASGYTVYEAKGESAGASGKTLLTKLNDLSGTATSFVPPNYSKEKLYLISATDSFGNTAAPVKTTYNGVEPFFPNITPEQEALVNDPMNIQVAAGYNHTLVVKADGTLWSFGINNYGQLGHSTNSGSGNPNPIPTKVLTDVKSVATGSYHTLVVKNDGTLWSFGNNYYGQLGHTINSGMNNPTPTPVQVLTGVKSVVAGHQHTLAVKEDGTLWSFGRNHFGQLGHSNNIGNGNPNPNPTPRQVLTEVKSVAAGDVHSLVVRTDGTLWGFGYNYYGQLGHTKNNGIGLPNPTPSQVLSEVKSVAAGSQHTLVIKLDGTLWSFGYNQSGQLGHTINSGNSDPNPTPRQNLTLTNVKAVTGGIYHSLAVKEDGTLWSFGHNKYGQLGYTTNNLYQNPIPKQVLTDVKLVAAGSYHTLTIKTDGTLWSFGHNPYGQLGFSAYSGDTSPNPTPAQVSFDQ